MKKNDTVKLTKTEKLDALHKQSVSTFMISQGVVIACIVLNLVNIIMAEDKWLFMQKFIELAIMLELSALVMGIPALVTKIIIIRKEKKNKINKEED